jgi:hypothetical protein
VVGERFAAIGSDGCSPAQDIRANMANIARVVHMLLRRRQGDPTALFLDMILLRYFKK